MPDPAAIAGERHMTPKDLHVLRGHTPCLVMCMSRGPWGHTVGLVLGQSKVTMRERVVWREEFVFLGEKKWERTKADLTYVEDASGTHNPSGSRDVHDGGEKRKQKNT